MKVFNLFFLYLSFLFSFNLKASEGLTLFVWQADTEKAFRGVCYEIDHETGGQKYIMKVNANNCRPKEVIYIWQQNEGRAGGKCYEVDKETSGQKFVSTSFPDRCRPKNISYTWQMNKRGKGKCYAIDSETGGGAYIVKAKPEKCRTSKNTKRWIVDKRNPYRGQCLLFDEETMGANYQEVLNVSKCRPLDTKFEWVQKDLSSTGTCYEVDKFAGPESFSIIVNRKKCMGSKPEITYQWIKEANKPFGGKCFEITTEPSGAQMSQSTKAIKCRPANVIIKFFKLRADRGRCLEVDAMTQGQEFARGISIDKCRPDASLLENAYFPKSEGFREGCYEYDKESKGMLFIEKVKDIKCQSSSRYEWVSDKSGWGGRCKSFVIVAGKEISNGVKPEFCRPKDVFVKFHNKEKMTGHCYEVDAKNGHEFYSLVIDRKKCRPKDIAYIFYKKVKEPAGNCFEVDKKTKGVNYNKKVGKKFCKENLFQDKLKKSMEDYAPIDRSQMP